MISLVAGLSGYSVREGKSSCVASMSSRDCPVPLAATTWHSLPSVCSKLVSSSLLRALGDVCPLRTSSTPCLILVTHLPASDCNGCWNCHIHCRHVDFSALMLFGERRCVHTGWYDASRPWPLNGRFRYYPSPVFPSLSVATKLVCRSIAASLDVRSCADSLVTCDLFLHM